MRSKTPETTNRFVAGSYDFLSLQPGKWGKSTGDWRLSTTSLQRRCSRRMPGAALCIRGERVREAQSEKRIPGFGAAYSI
jgi:hypothetical protein